MGRRKTFAGRRLKALIDLVAFSEPFQVATDSEKEQDDSEKTIDSTDDARVVKFTPLSSDTN